MLKLVYTDGWPILFEIQGWEAAINEIKARLGVWQELKLIGQGCDTHGGQ